MSTIEAYPHAGDSPGKPPIETLREFIQELGIGAEVSVHPAPHAEVCIFHGCRETDNILLTIIDEFGQRALCPAHAVRLIRREVLTSE